MIKRYFIPVLLLLFCACKTPNKLAKQLQPANAPAAASPMSCHIEGQILKEEKVPGNDSTSLCAKYPCKATVLLTGISGCGSSVSVTFNTGDTIEINFAYTLHSTSSIFSSMPTKFPGLKVGDHFAANAFQHMQLDNGSGLTVYDYVVVGKR